MPVCDSYYKVHRISNKYAPFCNPGYFFVTFVDLLTLWHLTEQKFFDLPIFIDTS